MKTILSRSNPEIKKVASLHQRKFRKTHKLFLAEGLRVCSTLIAGNWTPDTLYVTEQKQLEAHALMPSGNITVVSAPVMEKISASKTPSGIVGVFSIPLTPDSSALTSGIVLANISDPGNMGTLLRSAAAFGISSAVIVDGCDPFSPKVVQASAGTLCNLNLFVWSWQDLQNYKQDINLCAMVVKDGKKPQDISFDNILLVIGSEAHGIPEAWLNDCTERLTLPMPGKTESLNAAVAGSIAIYLGWV